jgi:hypothetical protein
MNKVVALLAIVAVCLVGFARAHDDHDHDHEEEVVREGKCPKIIVQYSK